MTDLARLHAPFPANEIEWRVGSISGDKTRGLALAYLTARHVMERLDAVCGPANWQDRYEFHGSRTVCYLSIRIGDEWVTKADGAGDSDVEAEKGAISDALKRAAVKWGIGRYLYELGNTWVEIEPAGRSFRIKDSEYARLESILQKRFDGTFVPGESTPPTFLSESESAPIHDEIDFLLEQSGQNLASVWKANWPRIQMLFPAHQEALTRKKDELKAKLPRAA